jgi:hypothetical protein
LDRTESLVPDAAEHYALLQQAKSLARRYYEATGRPLGVTGEIAEYEAVSILGLELAPVRQSGYDAVRVTASGPHRLQVKGRRVRGKGASGRMGRIDRDNQDWDGVLLVLLDENFDATQIFEADRDAVVGVLDKPGSKSRNERGALGVSQFKAIARCVWSREQ